ncbi:MAG: thioredoxin domain-containing protein [Spirochaetia bacterium]|nr:thioredoxin domain-containing protein [Spirochaetia bacterium]
MKRSALIAAALFAVSFLASCKDREGAFIELDGKKLTEADLEKAQPDQYKQLRRQYNSQVLSMLKSLANNRMIEMEAKSKGLPPDQYVRGVVEGARLPSDKELTERYAELKAGGQITESLGEIKDQLASVMMREGRDKLMTAELSRLRKKYKYNINRVEVKTKDEPTRLNPAAAVTVVEFSDFECPYCIRFQKTSIELRKKYGDKIKWVFRDFPLDFHPHAMGAHIAANCVYKQDKEKYWKYFDAVFSPERPKNALSPEGLEDQAFRLGINMDDFRKCQKDPEIEKKVRASIAEGESLGVNGTPAFFINGRMLSGALPLEEFSSVIDEEL